MQRYNPCMTCLCRPVCCTTIAWVGALSSSSHVRPVYADAYLARAVRDLARHRTVFGMNGKSKIWIITVIRKFALWILNFRTTWQAQRVQVLLVLLLTQRMDKEDHVLSIHTLVMNVVLVGSARESLPDSKPSTSVEIVSVRSEKGGFRCHEQEAEFCVMRSFSTHFSKQSQSDAC